MKSLLRAEDAWVLGGEDAALWAQLNSLFDELKMSKNYVLQEITMDGREIDWITLEEKLIHQIDLMEPHKFAKLLENFEKFSPIRAVEYLHEKLLSPKRFTSNRTAGSIFLFLAALSEHREIDKHIRPIVEFAFRVNERNFESFPFKKLCKAFPQVLDDEFVGTMMSGVTL